MIQVILCARNGEKYIEEQILSILHQTEKEIRLLISDDASTDSTAEIAEKYVNLFPGKVTLVRQSSPSGSACAHFLKALSLYGKDRDYVMFADQDDVWDGDKIEKTLNRMREAEKKYAPGTPLLVHADSRVTDADLCVICSSYVRYQKMSPQRNKLNELLVQNNVTGAALMINRPLITLVTGRNMPSYAVMHDHYLALTAAAFGKIIFVNEALYAYRQHARNDLGAAKGNPVREVLDRLGLFRKDKKNRQEADRHSRETYAALFRQAEEFYRLYANELSRKQKSLLRAFIRMQNENRITKIRTILCCGFTFNRLYRTVGECLFL